MITAAGGQTGRDSERSNTHPHVVIVGGGFAGLSAARRLARAPVSITMIDRRNFHLFQPLLYQVAGAALSAGDIAEPIRSVLARQKNAEVVLGCVRSIDLGRKRLTYDGGEIDYDRMILGVGARSTYFGKDEWAPFAPSLKTLDDALIIRQRILCAYERAEWSNDPDQRRKDLTFVVVGGGPTGVELAGALAEIARHTLKRDFRHIDPADSRIVLLEMDHEILTGFPAKLRAKARRYLEDLGVQVLVNTVVEQIGEELVRFGGQTLPASTILWAAGVTGVELTRTLGVELDRKGRVVVEADLTIPGHPDVYVCGDIAAVRDVDGGPLPGIAPVAIQMGRHAADNLRRELEGLARLPFRYKNRGMMATIGRRRAVAVIGKIRLAGGLAWLTWLFVHLMALVGFRNRIVVFVQWAWNYFTHERGSRLIRDGAKYADGSRARPEESTSSRSRIHSGGQLPGD